MAFEFQILDFIQELHTPILDAFMIFVSKLGDKGAVWIVLAVLLLAFPKTRKAGTIVAAALVIDAVLCNIILKPLVARVRPYDIHTAIEILVAKPRDFSFPSGHTAASFAAASALWFAKEGKLWMPAFVLAALIAFSRMYLYVHYPTDVLGGAILGIFCGWLAQMFMTNVNKLSQTQRDNQ